VAAGAGIIQFCLRPDRTGKIRKRLSPARPNLRRYWLDHAQHRQGFDDGSDAEFIHFLKYARRSASEVQSEIYLALDRKYVSAEDFQRVYDMATTTKKSINAFIAYLRKSKP
jgi:hypothetical protein